MTRFVEPGGEPEVGWVVRKGRIPLGYFDGPDATRKTFPPVVEGQRVVVSGDRASLESDGTLRLYGRDSLVVNTGGGEGVRGGGRGGAARPPPRRGRRTRGRTRQRPVGAGSGGTGADAPPGGRTSHPIHCMPRAPRSLLDSRRPRSSSWSKKRSVGSATGRPTTGGRRPKRAADRIRRRAANRIRRAAGHDTTRQPESH